MKRWSVAVYAAALTATTALTAPAVAHEERVFPGAGGNISMFIGFSEEPAFEDSYNGIDVILTSFNGFCPNGDDAIELPVDVRGTSGLADKDTVNLQVEALYLKAVAKPGGVLGVLPPPGIIAKLNITNKSPLRQAFGEVETYNSRFRPTHVGNPTDGGAYGFHVFGTIHAGQKKFTCPGTLRELTLTPRTVSVNSYFVCSLGGSLDTTPRSFNCVQAIQPFPGRALEGYLPSAATQNRAQ